MNDDVAELVERLDDGICDDWCKVRDAKSSCTCAEIASTIRAQAAENERLKECWKRSLEDNERLQEELQSTAMEALTAQGQAWEASDRIDAAEAKLREAVEVMREVRQIARGVNSGWFVDIADQIEIFLSTMEKPNG
jgi:hypothetical protein